MNGRYDLEKHKPLTTLFICISKFPTHQIMIMEDNVVESLKEIITSCFYSEVKPSTNFKKEITNIIQCMFMLIAMQIKIPVDFLFLSRFKT